MMFVSLNCPIRKLDINTGRIFRTHFPRPMMCSCHFKRECMLFLALRTFFFINIQCPTYFTFILMNCFHFDFLHRTLLSQPIEKIWHRERSGISKSKPEFALAISNKRLPSIHNVGVDDAHVFASRVTCETVIQVFVL